MPGYEDQADDGYYLDEPAGSFEQDLVYALDAGVRHTVNQALTQAIRPIKHHLLGFAEQQGWVAPSGIQSIMEPSLSAGTQATKQNGVSEIIREVHRRKEEKKRPLEDGVSEIIREVHRRKEEKKRPLEGNIV
ncbi:hypothetical protein NDU88_002511 [Pleurodeles waltl]|uniref:Uncharacterized protein n=1 Tax=Pleurodeles waltl TaxID=8319 RepID=A0AAV7LPH5_PLEWA|nr:hypothetical protein NDU88_002511 [Pleurodeles waltl]